MQRRDIDILKRLAVHGKRDAVTVSRLEYRACHLCVFEIGVREIALAERTARKIRSFTIGVSQISAVEITSNEYRMAQVTAFQVTTGEVDSFVLNACELFLSWGCHGLFEFAAFEV